MASPVRYRAYASDGTVVDRGAVKQGVAKVAPVGADAAQVVFYSGKAESEAVVGAAEVRLPVGMTSEVTLSN